MHAQRRGQHERLRQLANIIGHDFQPPIMPGELQRMHRDSESLSVLTTSMMAGHKPTILASQRHPPPRKPIGFPLFNQEDTVHLPRTQGETATPR